VRRSPLVGCSGAGSEASQEEQGRTEATTEQARSPQRTSEEARCEGTRTFKEKAYLHGGPLFTTNDVPGCPNKGGLLSGTVGRDKLDGKMGDDEIRGLGANDDLIGGLGSDVLYGGPGDDFLKGNTFMGDDHDRAKAVLHGGPGRDQMIGEEGDDLLYGGSGDDAPLIGAKGEDAIYGGDGNDFIDASGDGQRDKLYCGEGKDEYAAEKIDYVSRTCEEKVTLEPID
jgi:Ca2+-binding RTX toxin-like protein